MNIQFHITNECNLRCKHCYHGKYTPECISLENFELMLQKTVDFMKKTGDEPFSISLTGGEPMTIPNIEDYLSKASLYFKRVGMLSNGLLLTPENLKELKKIEKFNFIQVSLEGPEEINDMIRGKGTFQKIRRAIGYIKDAGFFCGVSYTLAPYNYDKIEELYNELNTYNSPDILWFDRCIPFKGIGVLTKEQFKFFIDTLAKLRVRWKEEKLPVNPRVSRALQWIADNKTPYICGAGMRHFTLMYNGDVMICRRLNFPVGNLLKEDWEDILVRIMPTLQEIHRLPDECKGCQHAQLCNGGLKCLTYTTLHSFNHKDINCYL